MSQKKINRSFSLNQATLQAELDNANKHRKMVVDMISKLRQVSFEIEPNLPFSDYREESNICHKLIVTKQFSVEADQVCMDQVLVIETKTAKTKPRTYFCAPVSKVEIGHNYIKTKGGSDREYPGVMFIPESHNNEFQSLKNKLASALGKSTNILVDKKAVHDSGINRVHFVRHK